MDKAKLVDVHSHFTSPQYLKFLERHGASLEDGFPLPTWDLKECLKLMEQCEIRYSLLSVSSPQPYFAGFEKEAIEICHLLNTQMAEIKEKYPKQFGFQAVLPLPNVDASIKEAIYAIDVLGAKGVKFASNSRGLYLGSSELEPLMVELNKRHAICNIHPHRPEPLKEGLFSSGPVPLYEFLADTTRSVLNLIDSGVILRYPEITWIVPHCGSFLPNIYDRIMGLSKVLIPKGLMQDIDLKASFAKLYFDLSGNPAPHLLDLLLTITTPEHIMYGSDFPFTPTASIKNNLDALLKMFERDDLALHKDKILFENAEKLLKV